MVTAEDWSEAQDTSVDLDASGRVIDFLSPDIHRPNTKEERVRQRFGKALHYELGYPKDHMAFEAPIQIGSGVHSKPVDIAIYKSAAARADTDQSQIALVVETKAPDVTTGRKQLFSYIFPSSAEGGVWTNGEEIAYFRRQQHPQDLLLWPGIPRFGRPWDSVGKFRKSDLVGPFDLKPVFKKCHNAIYRAGHSSEDVALDMIRIILAKQRDEINPGDYCDFACSPEEYATSSGRSATAKRVRALFEQVRSDSPDVFAENEVITADDSEVATVVTQLQHLSFLRSTYDVIGSAYETYVASHLRGERGQYFTNRLIVDLMVRMIAPTEDDRILDPASGSGGFLIGALNYIRARIEHSQRPELAKDAVLSSVKRRLFGVETSPKLVKIGKANMLLDRDGHTGIVRGNSLAPEAFLP